jgi:starvation-inducible DNA-binding protein
VVGPLFHPIHLMTEAQYEDLFAATDTLAERIRALGHPTAAPRIGHEPAATTRMSVAQLVADLVDDNEAIVRMMRDAAEAAEEARDHVTHDLLVARMTIHEKAIWMLRAVVAS